MKKTILAALCFFSGLLSLFPQAYTVAVIHSYEETHICGAPQQQGILEALEDAGISKENGNLSVFTYYMDTKRRNNTPRLIAAEARNALQLIDDVFPDLIVTIDDNAFRHVAMKFIDSDIPVVFCGVNGQIQDYIDEFGFALSMGGPGKNITGVYELLHLEDAVRVHSLIFPEFRSVRFLIDQSPTGKAIHKQIIQESVKFEQFCDWDLEIVETWEEYMDAIRRANQDDSVGAIYPAALLLKDQQEKSYTASEILPWTVEHSTKPELALNYSFVRYGIFGGAAVDFVSMGYQAGEIATKVLRGTKAGDVPIQEASKYALAFNIPRAKSLGIDIPTDILMEAEELVIE